MTDKKKVDPKQVFAESVSSADKRIDFNRKRQFANTMRRELNEKWIEENGDVSIDYWQGYAQRLEILLYETIEGQVMPK